MYVYRKRMWRIIVLFFRLPPNLDSLTSELANKLPSSTFEFCEAVMADQRRPSYYSAEEATMLFGGEKTTTVVSVKMRKLNWNITFKFLAKNRGKRSINCERMFNFVVFIILLFDRTDSWFRSKRPSIEMTCYLNFPWVFEFRLHSPVASVIPVMRLQW